VAAGGGGDPARQCRHGAAAAVRLGIRAAERRGGRAPAAVSLSCCCPLATLMAQGCAAASISDEWLPHGMISSFI